MLAALQVPFPSPRFSGSLVLRFAPSLCPLVSPICQLPAAPLLLGFMDSLLPPGPQFG
jgi:hypothetical protein